MLVTLVEDDREEETGGEPAAELDEPLALMLALVDEAVDETLAKSELEELAVDVTDDAVLDGLDVIDDKLEAPVDVLLMMLLEGLRIVVVLAEHRVGLQLYLATHNHA